jgi:hypothetical protein
MGLFSFLFGGRKDKAKPVAKATSPTPGVVEKTAPAMPVAPVAYTPASATGGVAQAKLRLRLVASLRSGDHPAAYQAARGLADIQTRAGRNMVARTWLQQAERIKTEGGLTA